MALTIPVAHDFICPWCWVGLLQVKRLQEEFDVEFEWRGFELFPEEMEWGYGTPTPPPPPNKPPVLSRFEFILACDGIEMPKSTRPFHMRTHNAHEALEYAHAEGAGDAFAEVLYRAYWERGEEINNPDVLHSLAEGTIKDVAAMDSAVKGRRFADRIIGFDDPAYNMGIYNVPTFYIGDDRYAEQPYVRLREALLRVV